MRKDVKGSREEKIDKSDIWNHWWAPKWWKLGLDLRQELSECWTMSMILTKTGNECSHNCPLTILERLTTLFFYTMVIQLFYLDLAWSFVIFRWDVKHFDNAFIKPCSLILSEITLNQKKRQKKCSP